MKNLLLFSLLLVFGFTKKEMDLDEALDRGWIEIEAFGNGGHSGKALRLGITNQAGKDWILRVPAGTIFHSTDTTEQDLMVIQSRTIELEKGKNRRVDLHARCIQSGNASPYEGSAFHLGSPAEGALGRLAGFIDEKNYTDPAAQYAIWAVTDCTSAANIDHPELRRFTSELLGIPEPEYTIIRNNEDIPGRPAFGSRPLIIKGAFNFQARQLLSATFAIYNSEGEPVRTYFENKRHIIGEHRYEFYFQLPGMPDGKYFVRMTDRNGAVLQELAVELG